MSLLFLEFCKWHLYVKVYMLYVLDCKVVIRPAEGNVRQFEEGAITGVRGQALIEGVITQPKTHGSMCRKPNKEIVTDIKHLTLTLKNTKF